MKALIRKWLGIPEPPAPPKYEWAWDIGWLDGFRSEKFTRAWVDAAEIGVYKRLVGTQEWVIWEVRAPMKRGPDVPPPPTGHDMIEDPPGLR